MRSIAWLAIAGIFAILVFTSMPSPAQVVGGSINGAVTDSSGAAMPGATVIIRNQETGSQRQLTTDGSGLYNAPSVSVGSYSVSASKDGFATQQRDGIVVTVGQAIRANLTLSASAVTQQIEVTDKPPTSTSQRNKPVASSTSVR